jgi:hypothetical protein
MAFNESRKYLAVSENKAFNASRKYLAVSENTIMSVLSVFMTSQVYGKKISPSLSMKRTNPVW